MSALGFLSRPSSRGRVGGPQLVHFHQLHTWVVSSSEAFGTAGFRAVLCPQLSKRVRRCLKSQGRLTLPTTATAAWPASNTRGLQPSSARVQGVSWWCWPISLVLSDADTVPCASWPFVYLLWSNVHSDPLPNLKLGCLFITELADFITKSTLHILDTNPLSDSVFASNSSHPVGCILTFFLK